MCGKFSQAEESSAASAARKRRRTSSRAAAAEEANPPVEAELAAPRSSRVALGPVAEDRRGSRPGRPRSASSATSRCLLAGQAAGEGEQRPVDAEPARSSSRGGSAGTRRRRVREHGDARRVEPPAERDLAQVGARAEDVRGAPQGRGRATRRSARTRASPAQPLELLQGAARSRPGGARARTPRRRRASRRAAAGPPAPPSAAARAPCWSRRRRRPAARGGRPRAATAAWRDAARQPARHPVHGVRLERRARAPRSSRTSTPCPRARRKAASAGAWLAGPPTSGGQIPETTRTFTDEGAARARGRAARAATSARTRTSSDGPGRRERDRRDEHGDRGAGHAPLGAEHARRAAAARAPRRRGRRPAGRGRPIVTGNDFVQPSTSWSAAGEEHDPGGVDRAARTPSPKTSADEPRHRHHEDRALRPRPSAPPRRACSGVPPRDAALAPALPVARLLGEQDQPHRRRSRPRSRVCGACATRSRPTASGRRRRRDKRRERRAQRDARPSRRSSRSTKEDDLAAVVAERPLRRAEGSGGTPASPSGADDERSRPPAPTTISATVCQSRRTARRPRSPARRSPIESAV